MATYTEACGQFYGEIKDQGLTPLDLYNWNALVLLETLTRAARRIGEKRDNIKEYRAFRGQLWDAMERKAKNIEKDEGDSTYIEWLEDLREEIRGRSKSRT